MDDIIRWLDTLEPGTEILTRTTGRSANAPTARGSS